MKRKRRTEVTPELLERMRELRMGGLTYREIAHELGFTHTTVCRHLREKQGFFNVSDELFRRLIRKFTGKKSRSGETKKKTKHRILTKKVRVFGKGIPLLLMIFFITAGLAAACLMLNMLRFTGVVKPIGTVEGIELPIGNIPEWSFGSKTFENAITITTNFDDVTVGIEFIEVSTIVKNFYKFDIIITPWDNLDNHVAVLTRYNPYAEFAILGGGRYTRSRSTTSPSG